MAARILVVEDNPTNLQLMLYLLKAFGHRATAAADGLSGLQLARRQQFDIILCDVLMPGIDGFEFARRYKTETAATQAPLVAVTALAMVGDKEALLAAGFDGYIAKPIDPETFIGQIDSYLPAELRSTAGATTRSGAEATGKDPSGPVILTVDDTQLNIDLVRSSLQPFGYRIVEAHNAQEGIERAHQAQPALILCDLHMAGGDGFELLREIKDSPDLHDVPFFFLSSTVWRTSEQIRGMQLGADKFLQRPIDPLALRDEIEVALATSERNGEDSGR